MPAPSQVIILGSSSPAPTPLSPPTWDLPIHHSSPPPLQLHVVRKAPVFKGGSRAEQIPAGAVAGFRSARDVVAELGLQEDTSGPGNDGAKKGRKRKSDEGAEPGEVKRAKKAADMADKQAASAGESVQTQITGRVNKSGLGKGDATSEKAIRVSMNEDEAVGKATISMPRPQAQGPPSRESRETQIASLERPDSSPPRALEASRNNVVEMNEETESRTQATFANLVGTFGYNGQTAPLEGATTSKNQTIHTTKPRSQPKPAAKSMSELTAAPAAAPAPEPRQASAPASKPQKPPAKSSRTVTKIVLAQYQSPEKAIDNAVVSYDAKMLQPLELTADGGTKKKRVSKSKSKRNAPPPPAKLLSPGQLKRRLQRQDMLFGTSSQLATEESPKSIRALQQAYKESEASIIDLTTPTISSRRLFGMGAATKGLWSAASRGDDDFVFAPTQEPPSGLDSGAEDDEFADIDLLNHAPTFDSVANVAEEQSLRLKLSSTSKKQGPRMRITNSPSFIMPSPPVVVQSTSICTTATHALREQSTLPLLEDDTNGPRSPISVQPKKARGRPRKDAAATTLAANAGEDAPVKKRRGRPPKDPNAPPKPRKAPVKKKQAIAVPVSDDFMPIEDAIDDPEPPLTPSPPRRRASPTKPLPLDLSPSSAAAAAVVARPQKPDPKVRKPVTKKEDRLENITRMEALFPHITLAVRNAPRGTQQHPSWWEKMLLYDPIVLEDFTAWLNNVGLREYGGLGLTVEPSVAQPETSKKQAKSTGKDTAPSILKLINDDDLWMVQKWCESNSICCLFKAGLRGGVRLVY